MHQPPIKTRDELQQQCAAIAYQEIQRFFAKGMMVLVADGVDIIDVAWLMQNNEVTTLTQLIAQKKVIRVHDKHAKKWSKKNTQLLAITVVPWLLVQEMPANFIAVDLILPVQPL